MWFWNGQFSSRWGNIKGTLVKTLNNVPSNNEGSILIGVLWSLFFLSALAVAIYGYISPQLGLAERTRDRMKMYYVAKAGVVRAMRAVQRDETQEVDALNDTWSFSEEGFKEVVVGDGTFSLERGEAQYGLMDEERKININKAPQAVLKHLFEVLAEITSQEASDLADSIVDWRDEDDDLLGNGAETGYYQVLDPPYTCKNADFSVVEELLLVKGMTQEVFEKVQDWITVFGAGAVNINTADTMVLQSLNLSAALADDIESFRKGSDGLEATEDDGFFEDVGSIAGSVNVSGDDVDVLTSLVSENLLTVKSNYFRGNSVGRLSGQEGTVKIVFVVDRNKKIKYWKE